MNFAEYLKSSPLIAILRGITVPEVPGVCAALLENGIALLEIPLNTPNALECIKEAGKYAANGTKSREGGQGKNRRPKMGKYIFVRARRDRHEVAPFDGIGCGRRIAFHMCGIACPITNIIGDFVKNSMLFLDFFARNHYNVGK